MSVDSKEYPLEREWSVWINGPAKPTSKSQRSKKFESPPPKFIGSFNYVHGMWQWMNSLPTPKHMTDDSNIHLFQHDIAPVWEHPANSKGGRWMYSIPTDSDELAATAWQNLYLGVIGETLDPGSEIAGVVLARRRNYTRLSIWTKNRFNAKEINLIGERVKANLPNSVKLEYQDHKAEFGTYRYTM